MRRIEAVLLAAGYSSRMGELKSLLPLGDTTVIRRQADMLRKVVDRTIVVTGYRADDVEKHLSGYDITVVHNPSYDEGMFTSVKAGIRALSPDIGDFLILPVDYPLITAELILRLLMAHSQSGAPVTYPSYQLRKGHPPVISAECIPKILDYSGNTGLKGALQPFHSFACYMETDDVRCVMDMDTPSDYQTILAMAAI